MELIWACEPSTCRGRASLTGKGRACRGSIACKRRFVLAMIKPQSAIEPPAVRTTATPVSTLLHAEDARLVTL